MYRIVYYLSLRGDCPVLEFIESLDEKAAAKTLAFIELLREIAPKTKRVAVFIDPSAVVIQT